MNRVFYYSGYRLTVFHWVNGKYVDSYGFNPDKEGFAEFQTYLQSTEKRPIKLLVDVIEEDFRREKIPHVGAKDRSAIINRMIDRQYRNSAGFVYYEITSREKSGRRDDNVLYSVLTNPNMLNPWIKLIEEAEVPIIGIWSLPMLSHELIVPLAIKDKNVLLVSQQVPSNLRQSFFKNGKFQISRSAVVNLEEIPLGQYIAEEVEQTTRFLSNQRYIGFDEILTVHVVCDSRDISEIQEYCEDTVIRTFHYHGLRDVQEKIGDTDLTKHYCNGIYAYLCNKRIIPKGHYGPRSLFTRYYRYLGSRAMIAASILLLLGSVIKLLSDVSDAQIMTEETRILENYTEVIENNYAKELEGLEPQLQQAVVMKSAVSFVDEINRNKNISPQTFMVDISKIITMSGINETRLNEIHWKRSQNYDLKSLAGRESEQISYGSNIEIKHISTIRGVIQDSGSSIKASVKIIESMIDAFKKDKRIEQVDIVQLPLDLRSKANIEKEEGVNVDKASASDRGQFEIRLLMQGENK